VIPAYENASAAYRGRMEVPPVRSPRFGRAAICIAVLVLAADQISKALVVAGAPRGSRGGLVAVRLVRNTGASSGIGAGHPVLITVVAAAVLAAAVIWLVRTRRPGAAPCLAVVAGGAAGNLADRLLRSPGPGRGAVVDWIHVAGYPATFNLADVAIRAGAVGALVATLAAARGTARRTATPGC
jgi:signal peptidase II